MSARSVLATVGATLAFATSCSGGEGDKAGGDRQAQPLVLTLESEDDLSLTGAPEFAAAVDRLSEGSMRIQFVYAGRGTEIEWEKGVVEDIRGGTAQLGIVDARVWDTLGVKSFQGLLAPFLIDSLELQRRVLESALATTMLDGVEQGGVVGIALLPGPLRHPFGITHSLMGPDDYRGTTIGIRPSGLMRTVLRALGAEAKVYVPGVLSGLDGAESNPKAIDYNSWAGALTINVVLWPKPYTIVMNRDAFDALTSEQRELLRDAGREALAPELEELVHDSSEALSAACARGAITLASASAADLAALREAVEPVYEELERDADTRELIGEITEMRSTEPPFWSALPRCREEKETAKAGPAALEGRWQMHWTREELLAVGIPPKQLRKDLPESGTVTYEFEAGRFKVIIADGTVVGSGTYDVEGNVLSLVYQAFAPPAGYIAGAVLRHRWSVYRDTLRFSRLRDSDADLVLLVNPLTRVP